MKQVSEEILESRSLWFRYKTLVWLQESPQRDVVHNTMRLLRSIRFRELAYVSVPITSGKFFYKLQLAHPRATRDELMTASINHNYQVGWEFAENLQKHRNCPILYPADLVPAHQQWEQDHFQALWLSIIGEFCTEIHMCEGWEFSNGGREEFAHVMQLRLGLPSHPKLIFFNTKNSEEAERKRMKTIMVYDHRGNAISLQDGVKLIEGARAWMKNRCLNGAKFENSLDLLHWTDSMIQQGFYQ